MLLSKFQEKLELIESIIAKRDREEDPKNLQYEVSALRKPKSVICSENIGSVRVFVHRMVKM